MSCDVIDNFTNIEIKREQTFAQNENPCTQILNLLRPVVCQHFN